MTSVEHYLSEHERVQDALPGSRNDWVNQLRESALARFQESGFPTTRMEDWKYTDVRTVRKQAFRIPGEAPSVSYADIEALLPPALDAHRLVFLNGHFQGGLSDIGPLPKGATVDSLARKLSDPDAALRHHLDRIGRDRASGYSELNAALMDDGLYVSLDNGVVLDKPVYVLFLGNQTGEEQPALANIRNFYHLGSSAEAAIIEHYAGPDGAQYFTNVVSEIETGNNAAMQYYKLQEESGQATHVASVNVHQSQDSRFVSHGADFGGRLVRTDINSTLDGEGAEARLYGLYMPGNKQHVDNHTRIDHAKPQGTSREYYKGILNKGGRGVFNGKVIVHPHAQKTDSDQKSDALLLSKKAEVDAKPELEIYADDVRCQHGSTVGQLDEEAIFYLQSRGVDLNAARSLLTYSFAADLIGEFQLEALQKRIRNILLKRLPDGDQIQKML